MKTGSIIGIAGVLLLLVSTVSATVYDVGGSYGNSQYSGQISINPDGTVNGFVVAGVVNGDLTVNDQSVTEGGASLESVSATQAVEITGGYGIASSYVNDQNGNEASLSSSVTNGNMIVSQGAEYGPPMFVPWGQEPINFLIAYNEVIVEGESGYAGTYLKNSQNDEAYVQSGFNNGAAEIMQEISSYPYEGEPVGTILVHSEQHNNLYGESAYARTDLKNSQNEQAYVQTNVGYGIATIDHEGYMHDSTYPTAALQDVESSFYSIINAQGWARSGDGKYTASSRLLSVSGVDTDFRGSQFAICHGTSVASGIDSAKMPDLNFGEASAEATYLSESTPSESLGLLYVFSDDNTGILETDNLGASAGVEQDGSDYYNYAQVLCEFGRVESNYGGTDFDTLHSPHNVRTVIRSYFTSDTGSVNQRIFNTKSRVADLVGSPDNFWGWTENEFFKQSNGIIDAGLAGLGPSPVTAHYTFTGSETNNVKAKSFYATDPPMHEVSIA
jgi:hypothetical protein